MILDLSVPFVFTLVNLVRSDPLPNCTIYRDNLGKALSSYTSCAITYSQPISFCESCVNKYIDILDTYQDLTTTEDNNGPCINHYVNLDRLQILRTLYTNSYDLWNRAKCYECFQVENGKLTNKSSTETTTFKELFNNITNCINKTDHNKNNSAVCGNCYDDYIKLNEYYISISNENENIGVCMDIVDLMNGTRTYWSKNCCKFRHKDEYIFLISTTSVIVFTMLFYLCVKLWSEKKMPTILRQTRLAASFNQNHN